MSDETHGFARARAAAASRGGNFSDDDEVALKVPKGGEVTVRFLEQGEQVDKQWCYVHEMPPRGKMKWGDHVPCLDQEGAGTVRCPACEAGLERSIEGYLNVIWRNGPVYATKKVDGKDRIDWKSVTGHADVLAVWTVGISRLEDLDAIDQKYRGLATRDFDIARNNADSFDTRYNIQPHLDEEGNAQATPPSEADHKLAEGKADLVARCKPGTFEQMVAMLQGGSANTATQTEPDEDDVAAAFDRAASASPFAKK